MVQNKSVITRQNRCWFFFPSFLAFCMPVCAQQRAQANKKPDFTCTTCPAWPSLDGGTSSFTLENSALPCCIHLPFWEAEVSLSAKWNRDTEFQLTSGLCTPDFFFCQDVLWNNSFLESWLLNPNFFLFSFNATNELLLCFKYLF